MKCFLCYALDIPRAVDLFRRLGNRTTAACVVTHVFPEQHMLVLEAAQRPWPERSTTLHDALLVEVQQSFLEDHTI